MEEILYILVITMMMPLSFGGVYLIMDKVIERIRIKMGHLKVIYRTKNYRLKKKFSKPKGGKISVGKHNLPFNNDPEFIGFDGPSPVTIYNELGRQVNISTPEEEPEIDPDYYSNLVTEAYNLGIVSSIRKDKTLMLFIMIAIALAGAAAAFGFLNWQNVQTVVA